MKNIWVVYYFPVVCGIFFLCLNPSQAQLSLPPPTVETGDAISITSRSATLTGTSSYQRVPGAWFDYGTTSGSYTGSVSATPTFVVSKELWSADVSGLLPATAYYYRIAAYDSWPGGRSDTAYGDEKSFTTLSVTETPVPTPTATPTPQTPTVITGRGGRFFDENTVVFYGTVNPNGLSTTVWAEYGTNSSAYDHTSTTQSLHGTATQRVRFDISGLPYKFGGEYYYYYRIAAQNSAGTSYGNGKGDALKMTRFSSGTSITDDATNITSDSATLSGRCYAISPSRWFEYDTVDGEYFYEADAYSCTADGYCASLSGLSPATTYFYRMAGEDKDIVYYGETKSFVTLNATPTPPPECNPVSITVSPKRLILQRGQGSEVTVTLQGDNCIPEGKTITATIGKAGGRRISISSAREVTDANGQAGFTITAKYKIGNAKVTFNADSLKKALTVLVRQ